MTDLEHGIATLNLGRLPIQLFLPAQLKTVMVSVGDNLSSGWSFSTNRGRGDNLWNTYRDAEVKTVILRFSSAITVCKYSRVSLLACDIMEVCNDNQDYLIWKWKVHVALFLV